MVEVFVGFSRPHKWWLPMAWLIRCIDGTPYSHTYLRFRHTSGVEVIYEASGTAIRFKAKHVFDQDNKTIKEYRFGITAKQRKQLVSFMLANAGVDYGFKQLFGIGLVRLFGLKKNPYADGRKSQVCSEVIGYLLGDVLKLEHGLDLDIAGPKDIDKYIQELQGEVHD